MSVEPSDSSSEPKPMSESLIDLDATVAMLSICAQQYEDSAYVADTPTLARFHVAQTERGKFLRALAESLPALIQTQGKLAEAEKTVAFFASVIKSGESWTSTCQAARDKVFGVPSEETTG